MNLFTYHLHTPLILGVTQERHFTPCRPEYLDHTPYKIASRPRNKSPLPPNLAGSRSPLASPYH